MSATPSVSNKSDRRSASEARATTTVVEAARTLGISRNSAYAAVSRGDIPSVRIGRRIVVPTARLREMLEG
jgi:excisionase family DNA binding protein